ncbi:MAG: alginate lyase family protein [Anaerolineales bacterium]|nr:alginate lyase family protein [Anaerolineales bacterium]
MPIELPAHVHPTRMRRIGDADLFAALDLTPPALAAVRAAAAAEDWPAAYAAWAAYFAHRVAPRLVINLRGYAALPAELRATRGAPILERARVLHTETADYLGARQGQAQLYGLHYFTWLAPLVTAHTLDGDPAHAAAFARHFAAWDAVRDQVAGTIPSLDVIWYTLGLAIRSRAFLDAYAAFHASLALPPALHAGLLKSWLGAARWLAEEHAGFRYGNWQIHGAATLYELGVCLPEFREAAAWQAQGWARLIEHLDLDVYADGGHSERAPSYHAHVLAVYRRVAAVAEQNGRPPLQAHPRFAGLHRWLAEHLNPLGASTNFNDSQVIWVGEWAVPGAVLLADPLLKGLAEHFAAPGDVAWTLAGLPDRAGGETAAEAYARLPAPAPAAAGALQPDSKFALLRDGLAPDDLFLAVNYGPLIGHEYESHSHLDALAFVAAGRGAPLALEAGLALDTYDSPRYKTWLRRAAAHNMVSVNDQDPDEAAKDGALLAWDSSPLADVFAAAHTGYAAQGVRAHRRLILFVKGEYWLIHDALDQTGAPELDWRLFTPHPLEYAAGRWLPTRYPGLVVAPVFPAQGRWQAVGGFAVVPGPRAYEGTITMRDVPGLSHRQQTNAARAVYLHLLYPARAAAEAQVVSAEPLPLDEGTGEAARLVTGQGADVFLASAVGVARAGGWRADAQAAWLRAPGCWALHAARRLERAGEALFLATAPLTAAHLWPTPLGAAARLDTSRRASVTLTLPWPVARVYLNDIRLPEAVDGGAAVRVLLPGPGQYTLTLRPAPERLPGGR